MIGKGRHRRLTSKAEHISHMPSDNERKDKIRGERGERRRKRPKEKQKGWHKEEEEAERRGKQGEQGGNCQTKRRGAAQLL